MIPCNSLLEFATLKLLYLPECPVKLLDIFLGYLRQDSIGTVLIGLEANDPREYWRLSADNYIKVTHKRVYQALTLQIDHFGGSE